jgi:alpha-2-macroglobulin
LSLSRQFFKLAEGCGEPGQAPCLPVTEAQVGDTLRVKLTLIVPAETAYVRVDDYVPTGAEVTALPRESTAADSTLTDGPEAGAGHFTVVAGMDRLTLFAADLPAGTYSYMYQITAQRAGRYAVRPPLAQAVYLPDIWGRGAGSVLTVRP